MGSSFVDTFEGDPITTGLGRKLWIQDFCMRNYQQIVQLNVDQYTSKSVLVPPSVFTDYFIRCSTDDLSLGQKNVDYIDYLESLLDNYSEFQDKHLIIPSIIVSLADISGGTLNTERLLSILQKYLHPYSEPYTSILNCFLSVDLLSISKSAETVKISTKIILELLHRVHLNNLSDKLSEIEFQEYNSAFSEYADVMYDVFILAVGKLFKNNATPKEWEDLFRSYRLNFEYLNYFNLLNVRRGILDEVLLGNSEIMILVHEKLRNNLKEQVFLVPARAENAHEGIQILPLSAYLDSDNSYELYSLKKFYSRIPPLAMCEYKSEGDAFGLLVNIPMPYDLEQLFQRLLILNGGVSDKVEAYILIINELVLDDYYREKLFPDIFNQNDILLIKNLTGDYSNIRAVGTLKYFGRFVGLSESASRFLKILSKGVILEAINQLVTSRTERAIENLGISSSAKGAGATLPGSLLKDGKVRLDSELAENITSGHKVTILLMIESMFNALKAKNGWTNTELLNYINTNSLGVIGGGYIGEAIIQSISTAYPNAKFVVYEKKRSKAIDLKAKYGDKVEIVESSDKVFEKCQGIFAAPRGKIEMSESINCHYYRDTIVIDDAEPSCLPKNADSLFGIIPIKPLARNGSLDLLGLKKTMSSAMLTLSDDTKRMNLQAMMKSLEDFISKHDGQFHYHKATLLKPIHDITDVYSYGILYTKDAEAGDPPIYINPKTGRLTYEQKPNPGLLDNALFGCELESILCMILGPVFANFKSVTGEMITDMKDYGIYDFISSLVPTDNFQYNGIKKGFGFVRPTKDMEILEAEPAGD